MTGHQGIGAIGQGDQLIGGINMIVRVEVRIVVPAQARLHGFGQFARDHDFWLRAHARILQ